MLRMSMKLTLLALAIVPLACGDDPEETDGTNSDSTGGDDDDDDDDDDDADADADADASLSATESDTSATDPDTSATDPDTSATDPDTSATDTSATESESGGACTPTDECDEDMDCAPGQTCVGCICFGEPTGCADYGEGVFGDCLNNPDTICEADTGSCIVDNVTTPTVGVCFFPCEEACDCPEPPDGFQEQLACEDLTGEGDLDCFIDCGGGADCPDDMFCFAGTLCVFGEPPTELPPYGDCINEVGACADNGLCLQRDEFAVCGNACDAVGDCPDAPATGDAPIICVDVTNDDMNECVLDCSDDQTCPDGMVCDPLGIGICVWLEGAAPTDPYGDCSADPLNCLAGEDCISDADGAVCAETGCMNPNACGDAPATGDAPVACGDIDGSGNVCFLDCSGGETCPDGMICADGGYCEFPAA